jgi:hypothetical protein
MMIKPTLERIHEWNHANMFDALDETTEESAIILVKHITDIDIDAFKTDLNTLYPNKEVYVGSRGAREDDPKKGMKYSYRVYVDGVKWQQVPFFTDSQPRREYRVEYDSTYTAFVIFGNNRAGLIPNQGSNILIVYRQGGL